MILLIGNTSDPSLGKILHTLSARETDYVWLRPESCPSSDLTLQVIAGKTDGRLRLGGADYLLNEFTGVYVAPDAFRQMMGRGTGARHEPRGRVFTDLLSRWLALSPVRVINRPLSEQTAIDVHALRHAGKKLGFSLPARLVTNDAEQLKTFLHQHRLVTRRPLLGETSERQELDATAAPNLAALTQESASYEARTFGLDSLVYVIGGHVWADPGARITLGETAPEPWPGRQDNSLTELNGPCATRCRRLVKALGLGFAAVNLRRQEDGKFVLLGLDEVIGDATAEHTEAVASHIVEFLEAGTAIIDEEAADSRPPAWA